ncbi:hypothetical protein PR048_009502 [Dryococelus australis]|uniref:Uncharacterized protein n=1 Tax=Dryococelus australis TaxID=614101 RepID=A0ABQ9I030_9NEOP|nr:hypothetical protein PR048_009502 [Dryococelus australis]
MILQIVLPVFIPSSLSDAERYCLLGDVSHRLSVAKQQVLTKLEHGRAVLSCKLYFPILLFLYLFIPDLFVTWLVYLPFRQADPELRVCYNPVGDPVLKMELC